MRVAIRADASESLGSGHIRRTLALACALRARGAEVFYVSRAGRGDMRDVLQNQNFAVYDSLDAGHKADCLVIDNYDLGASWETAARRNVRCICAIDDLGREHDCEILLDQNLGAGPARYAGKVPRTASLLLGPCYALLREEFRQYAAAPPKRSGKISRILVSMGGFDARNETGKVLDALWDITAREIAVDVVLPAAAPHAAVIAEQCARYGFSHHERVARMSDLMVRADLAIGSMGGTAWERCLLSLPSVVITIAENQRAGASACDRFGAAMWLGDSEHVTAAQIRSAVFEFASHPDMLQRAAHAARNASGSTDGVFSTDRAADAIMERFDG